MRKLKAQSNFYIRQPEIMSSEDRLDFAYWHPKYDPLIAVLALRKSEMKELDSLARSPIISGKTPDDYVFPMKGVLFIGARNVKNGKVDLTDITYIDDYVNEGMLKSSKVVTGDVLVTMAGAIGRTAMYNDSREANISQAVARIQPKIEEVNPQYLVYYLNSYWGQIQFDRDRHDVNQPNINTTEIGRIEVLLPPKREIQDEIVTKLSKMEGEIASESVKQENILQELRSVILVELGLSVPIARCDYYSEAFAELGERLDFVWNQPSTTLIKKYLEYNHAVPLGSLIESNIAYGLNAYGKEKGKVPFINVENLDIDGLISSKGIRYVDHAPEEKLLKEEDILISRSRTVGICGLVTKKEEGYTFGSYILRLRVKPTVELNPLYIVSFVNSEMGQAQITFLQTGSRQAVRGGGNNINPDQLKQLMVVLPRTPEHQTVIIDKIKQLLARKEETETQLKEKLSVFSKAFETFFNL